MTTQLVAKNNIHTMIPKLPGGALHSALSTSSVNFIVTANKLYAHPIHVPSVARLSKVSIGIVLGGAGGNIRIGIYHDAAGVPASLLLDIGEITVAGTAEIALKALSSPLGITPGLYWFASVFDAAVRVSAISSGSGPLSWLGLSSNIDANSYGGVVGDHTYGALPNPFPTLALFASPPIIGGQL